MNSSLNPRLFRKRLIPDETVELKNDEIVFSDNGVIVTNWKPIKPRNDIGRGESCYLIEKGIKVSRFYDIGYRFIYWYCDIIETKHEPVENIYVFTDLLADVKVYADGFVRVLDIDEIHRAYDEGIIDEVRLIDILKKLSYLLDVIYGQGLKVLCGDYLDLALS